MTDTLYQEALELWGEDFQLDLAVEEASELIKAVCKLKRATAVEDRALSLSALSDELADNIIMIEQLSYQYGLNELVSIQVQQKRERLQKRIAKKLSS